MNTNKLKITRMKFRVIIWMILFIPACSEEPVTTVYAPLDTGNGVFISCEGNFMYGNASLSFYDSDRKIVWNQLFYSRNVTPLGDVAQSLAMFGNTLFIVINNSGKVYAVDPETIRFKGAVTGLTSPRYLHVISGEKAYISDLYSHHITVVDPVSLAEIKKIALPDNHTSEQMVTLGNKVFVTSWSYDKYVLVLDAEKDSFVAKIEVPWQPREMVADHLNRLWVLSDGGFDGQNEDSGSPALARIDPLTLTVEKIFRFPKGTSVHDLETNHRGDTLFFINGSVFKMAADAKAIPDDPFIPREKGLFYSMGVDPETQEVYVADAIDYTQNALVYRYSSAGNVLDSFRVGINPSDFLFTGGLPDASGIFRLNE